MIPIVKNITATRGDTVLLPLTVTIPAGSTTRVHLRNTPDSETYYVLSIVGTNAVIPEIVSAACLESWVADVEYTTAMGVVGTTQHFNIYFKEDVSRVYGEEASSLTSDFERREITAEKYYIRKPDNEIVEITEGKTAYDSYVDTTTDDPVLSEGDWILSLQADVTKEAIEAVLTGEITSHTHASEFGDVTGGNYAEFNENGVLKLHGLATVFEDLRFDAQNVKVQGSGVSVNPTDSTVDFLTSANDADYMFVSPQMPHAKLNGSKIFPHIHFFQAQANIPNFALQYRWQINGGSKVTGWTAVKCVTPAHEYLSGTLNQIVHTVAGISPPTLENLSDIVQFRIVRDTTNALGLSFAADPYTATVGVLSFDCHIELDSMGSDQEYIK